MTSPEHINTILKHIVSNKESEDDRQMLGQLLHVGNEQNVVQLGKYSINIGEGKDIQIGDHIYQGTDAETIRNIVRSLLEELLRTTQASIEELLAKAYEALNLNNFEGLLDVCNKIIESQPNHPKANLMKVVALLKGNGADYLRGVTFVELESHIKRVLHEPGLCDLSEIATAWALWGLVKFDHYVPHGLTMSEPKIRKIKNELQEIGISGVDCFLLGKVKASQDALEYFNLT